VDERRAFTTHNCGRYVGIRTPNDSLLTVAMALACPAVLQPVHVHVRVCVCVHCTALLEHAAAIRPCNARTREGGGSPTECLLADGTPV
jgi:hypothetical protein